MNIKTIFLIAVFAVLTACSRAPDTEFDAPKMQLPGAEDYTQGLDYLKQDNVTQAMPWLLKAAKQENPEAQYQLGLLNVRGEAIEKDLDQAREWLLKASMQGHPKAQYYLGHMYGTGNGVEQDFVEACVWFWLASSYGDKAAKRYMRVTVMKLDHEQYAKAEKRVNELWAKMPHDVFMVEEKMPMH